LYSYFKRACRRGFVFLGFYKVQLSQFIAAIFPLFLQVAIRNWAFICNAPGEVEEDVTGRAFDRGKTKLTAQSLSVVSVGACSNWSLERC
jgi:hypothetical protein